LVGAILVTSQTVFPRYSYRYVAFFVGIFGHASSSVFALPAKENPRNIAKEVYFQKLKNDINKKRNKKTKDHGLKEDASD